MSMLALTGLLAGFDNGTFFELRAKQRAHLRPGME